MERSLSNVEGLLALSFVFCTIPQKKLKLSCFARYDDTISLVKVYMLESSTLSVHPKTTLPIINSKNNIRHDAWPNLFNLVFFILLTSFLLQFVTKVVIIFYL